MATVRSISKHPEAKARGHRYEFEDPSKAIETFEEKMSKWKARADADGLARFDELIPNIAFGARMGNGYSIYYELEL